MNAYQNTGLRTVRLAVLTPFVIVLALLSRPRVLRWCLTALYVAVVTPLALWQRWRPGSDLRGWRPGRSRPGWHAVDQRSHNKDLYRSEA
jgi:hypothetical protein